MNNKEIRGRALSKVKTKMKGLTAIVVVGYLINSVLGLFGSASGSVVMTIVGVIANIAIAFITAGVAKVGMQAWREGNVQWRDLFICFRTRRYLLCGLYGGMFSASFGVLAGLVGMLLGNSAGQAASTILGVAATLCTSYIVYAADLFEKKEPLAMAKLGVKTLFKNLGRVIGMLLNLYGWIIIVLVILFLFFAVVGGVVGVPLYLVLFAVQVMIKWAIGSYIVLSEAGLGRTLLKG